MKQKKKEKTVFLCLILYVADDLCLANKEKCFFWEEVVEQRLWRGSKRCVEHVESFKRMSVKFFWQLAITQDGSSLPYSY